MSGSKQRMLVLVGSYAEASDSGVYVYSFDEEREELTLLDRTAGLQNPTFLNVDVPRRRVYSIAEGVSAEGGKTGVAVALELSEEGKLQELNRVTGVDTPLCHIQRDASDRYLVLSSYHGAKVGLMSLTEDGRIGEPLDAKRHEGQGANPSRQKQPHPHSATFTPDNRYVLIADLGIDRIRAYSVNTERGELVFERDTALHPGAGPRHMAFHPSGELVYVINEVDSTVTAFRYDSASGTLETIEAVSTLPSDFQGENTTAEVAVSADGKYLYGSNRGHDSIAVFAIDAASGRLTLLQHVSSGGGHPRHFALTPGGRHLIAANRDSNNLVIFRVGDDGRLTATGRSMEVSKPVCVKPVYM
ncbi:lactonase family protein [Paenibacillus sp. GD4]|uniref:lactonase family protein n=1 Tax=Paenibacillus sp. GD4 TaxID=3068890 RepID=UPI002796CF98|nr:lactonase family protein [Paenibacillus sp. GD4]MDQ1912186.1 lactonase family protein [Paenibacillus sp. GD4]